MEKKKKKRVLFFHQRSLLLVIKCKLPELYNVDDILALRFSNYGKFSEDLNTLEILAVWMLS